MKKNIKGIILIFSLLLLGGFLMFSSDVKAADATGQGTSGQIVSETLPGNTGAPSQFVRCGRAGQKMCTLCDLIAGLKLIIDWIMRISIGVGILAFAAGGVMYVVSAGDPGLKGTANSTMKNAGIGFVVILSAWLIVNTVITSLGSRTDANGNPTFGMNITSWGQFECSANSSR